MSTIEQVILNSYKKVLEEMGREVTATLDVEIGRESGLDSLGLVNLMVEIEEELDITLESVLVQIRQSQTLKQLVPLVQKATEVCKQ